MSTRRRIIVTLFIFSLLVPIYTLADNLHWNKGRGYQPFPNATPDGILISNSTDTLQWNYYSLPKVAEDFTLRFRSKNLHGNPGKRYRYLTSDLKEMRIKFTEWGLIMVTQADTLVMRVKTGEQPSAIESVPSLEISLWSSSAGEIEKVNLIKNINPFEGDNLWECKLENQHLKISAGNTGLEKVFEKAIKEAITGFGFFCGSGGEVLISDISAYINDDDTPRFEIDESVIQQASLSNDPLEGIWMMFDRELEESLLKTGGDYKLLCLKDDNNYLFLYLDGARVNVDNWSIGDVKAILTPTPFHGIYNVEWKDAMKESFVNDIRAQKGDTDILTIMFPYQQSKLRLRKVNIL
ncbi:MAG: hypothetical protein J1F16_08305 [Muribaculaceae bacterium]|nr:hypothetical protein [Muribaculaceae bacterium]